MKPLLSSFFDPVLIFIILAMKTSSNNQLCVKSMLLRINLHVRLPTYLHFDLFTYILTSTLIPTNQPVFILINLHTLILTYLTTYLGLITDLPTYLSTHFPTYLSTYLPTYIPSFMPIYMPSMFLPTNSFPPIYSTKLGFKIIAPFSFFFSFL